MSTETFTESVTLSSWAEDYFLVAIFALVGALGLGAGIAGESQVQMSIGLIVVLFAARMLGDILRQRSAQKA